MSVIPKEVKNTQLYHAFKNFPSCHQELQIWAQGNERWNKLYAIEHYMIQWLATGWILKASNLYHFELWKWDKKHRTTSAFSIEPPDISVFTLSATVKHPHPSVIFSLFFKLPLSHHVIRFEKRITPKQLIQDLF